MRVPNSIMVRDVTSRLSQVSEKLSRLQVEVSSGLRIQRPSDDPNGALRATSLRSDLAQFGQYKMATTDSTSWLKSEDVSLGQLQGLIRQVRTHALEASNPQGSESLSAIAAQVDTLNVNLVQVANSSDGTRYLFAGYKTTTVPFSAAPGPAVTYAGDSGARIETIGPGLTLQINHTGDQVFHTGVAGENDLFQTVSTLSDAIRTNNRTQITTALNELDAHMARVTSTRAETGVRLQQINLSQDRLDQNTLTLTNLLTNTEGSDLTEALVHLKEQENIFQAATYVASSLAKGGLLNWLR
ncbi:MAG: flagellar hook-associated protein FlgL [Armatimonadota bacterium]